MPGRHRECAIGGGQISELRLRQVDGEVEDVLASPTTACALPNALTAFASDVTAVCALPCFEISTVLPAP